MLTGRTLSGGGVLISTGLGAGSGLAKGAADALVGTGWAQSEQRSTLTRFHLEGNQHMKQQSRSRKEADKE